MRIDRQSKWGNQFVEGEDGDREYVVTSHAVCFALKPSLHQALDELQGKVLGCWCCPETCHGDIVLKWLACPEEARATAGMMEALTTLWHQLDEERRTDLLLDIGALTPQQDPRRPKTERVLEAFKASPRGTTRAHLATLTNLAPQDVSSIIQRLEQRKQVVKAGEGRYALKTRSNQ